MRNRRSIRPVHRDDAAAIAAIYRPIVETTAISFETVAPTEQEIERRIKAITARYPWLVAEEDGKAIGYVYAGSHHERAAYRWSVDTTVYLAEASRGKGLGKRLCTELLGILRSLGYVSAYAGVTLPNVGSVALHESLGFTPIGSFRNAGYKFDRWHHVGYWHLALCAPPKRPDEPRLWPDASQ